MNFYYIWNTEKESVVCSNSHRSGIYTSLMSAVFAFGQLSWNMKKICKLIKVEIFKVEEVEL